MLGIGAAFDRSSYAPGETAQLTVSSDAVGLTVRVVDVAGSEVQPTVNRLDGPDVVEPQTVPVGGEPRQLGDVPVTIGGWKPGVYFAALSNEAGDVGYAPLIVGRRRRTAASRCSCPTRRGLRTTSTTTIATAFRTRGTPAARSILALGRPFEHAGVPWQFGGQVWPFLRWARLHAGGRGLPCGGRCRETRRTLPADYDLIVVPTHLEYVTETEYDVLQHYRDEGGDLIFLASNDLYWKVDIDGTSMHKVARWRELGRRSRRWSERSTPARRPATWLRMSSRTRLRPLGRSQERSDAGGALQLRGHRVRRHDRRVAAGDAGACDGADRDSPR